MCVRAKRNSSDSSYFLYSGSISWNGILSLYSNASNKWSSLFRALLTSSSSWVRSMILRTVSYFCSISLNARHDVTEIWNQFYSKLSKFGFFGQDLPVWWGRYWVSFWFHLQKLNLVCVLSKELLFINWGKLLSPSLSQKFHDFTVFLCKKMFTHPRWNYEASYQRQLIIL